MSRKNCLPVLFVIALFVAATGTCGNSGSGGGAYTPSGGQPREMRWSLVGGETTSHALDRWEAAFTDCDLVSHAASVDKTGVTRHLVIWYSCQADKQ